MAKTLFNPKLLSTPRTRERQELTIQLPLAIAAAFAVTILIYLFLLPIRTSYLGNLLYNRGLTQPFTIFLACIVAAFTTLKFIKLQKEFLALNQDCVPTHISLEDPQAPQVAKLQQNLAYTKSLIATRCSRVLAVYLQSGDRKTATEFALDDSTFYTAALEASYSVPRILVWAIPILGFIGTVIGISNAVSGFSGFLSEAADIEQIKQGIGTVTNGLAIGFDTTLLALCLSVLVMIPLVFAERLESRLLLAIDIYINDKVLSKLRDTSANWDERAIYKTVKNALQESFPSPEALVQPAHAYARQAATALAKGFLVEISKVQGVSTQIIEKMGEVSQVALQDRQEFLAFFEQQRQISHTTFTDLISEFQAVNSQLLTEVKASNSAVADSLTQQANQLSMRLEQAAKALDTRIAALEQCATQVSEIAKLHQSLEQTVHSLEQTAQLEHVLVGVRERLTQLTPILEQLNRPRRITLVERDDRSLDVHA